MGFGGVIALNLLLQFTCLAIAILIFAKYCSNNAAFRYAVLSRGLVALLVLTVLSVFLQYSDNSLLHVQLDSSALRSWERIVVPYSDMAALSELRIPNANVDTLESAGPQVASTRFAGNSLLANILQIPYLALLLSVWILGLLFHCVRLLRSMQQVGSLLRNSRSLKTSEKLVITDTLSGISKFPQGLDIRISQGISSPVLAGVFTPAILLPENFLLHLRLGQLRSVLRHELAHYQRGDPLANLYHKIIVAIMWIHPLVHRIEEMLVQAREEVCDNYVLANESPIEYGEVLLHVCSLKKSDSFHGSAATSQLQLGIGDGAWSIEDRIKGLLNQKRERTMNVDKRSKILFNVTIFSFSIAISACQVGAQTGTSTDTNSIQQAAGSASVDQNDSANTLSPAMMQVISDVQTLMQPEEDGEPDLDGAKLLLDSLAAERLEEMNDFEKSTLYNFYTNYYLALGDYEEAANTFETLLEIETIRDDIRSRALRSLGQLYAALENWSASIENLELWQSAGNQDDHVVLRGLSYANYQLENYDAALPHWLDYMALKQDEGEILPREDYAYLNGLHFTLGNWEQALELTKEMILLFNSETDWNNLRAIHRQLDESENV